MWSHFAFICVCMCVCVKRWVEGGDRWPHSPRNDVPCSGILVNQGWWNSITMKTSVSAIHPKNAAIAISHPPSWQMKAPSAWWVSGSLQESGWRESSQNIDSPACACSELIVNFSWSMEGVSLNNISALWFNPTRTIFFFLFFFLHAWVNSYACQSACCSAGLCVAAVVVHKGCVNMCVCQPLTLCSFPSKLIWLLTRLDGKGPGARSAHSISRWESPLCCHHKAFLLTGHAQWATPHTAPPPPPPCSSQGLFEPVSWRWRWRSLLFLIWPSKPVMGTVGWQGRKGGGVFFSKSSLGSRADMSLIISTLCSGSVAGMQWPSASHAGPPEASQWFC